MNKIVIVRVDGGICSQIKFVAYGLEVARIHGCKVKYDLSWFEFDGKDADGNGARNWDFARCFADIPIEIATPEEIAVAKNKYYVDAPTPEECPCPAYVGGYPAGAPPLFKQRTLLQSAFRPDLTGDESLLKAQLSTFNACAIHVRRGDLSVYRPGYGYPASVSYFIRAMKMVQGLSPNVKFYIFSDGFEWVRSELIPELKDFDYTLCESNGDDRGYVDLYLMAQCKYMISSVGSLGPFATLLSTCNQILFMHRERPFFSRHLENVVYINDDNEIIHPETSQVVIDNSTRAKLRRKASKFLKFLRLK